MLTGPDFKHWTESGTCDMSLIQTKQVLAPICRDKLRLQVYMCFFPQFQVALKFRFSWGVPRCWPHFKHLGAHPDFMSEVSDRSVWAQMVCLRSLGPLGSVCLFMFVLSCAARRLRCDCTPSADQATYAQKVLNKLQVLETSFSGRTRCC